MSVDERRQLQVRVGVGADSRVLPVGPTGAVAVNPARVVASAREAVGSATVLARGSGAAPAAGRDVVPAGTWHGRL